MWTLRQSESQGFAGCLSSQTLEAPSDVATVVLASLGHGMPWHAIAVSLPGFCNRPTCHRPAPAW